MPSNHHILLALQVIPQGPRHADFSSLRLAPLSLSFLNGKRLPGVSTPGRRFPLSFLAFLRLREYLPSPHRVEAREISKVSQLGILLRKCFAPGAGYRSELAYGQRQLGERDVIMDRNVTVEVHRLRDDGPEELPLTRADIKLAV